MFATILQATDATDGKLHVYWMGMLAVVIVAVVIYFVRRKKGS